MVLTCSVNGPILEWAQPDGNTIGTFYQNNPVGHGFSNNFSCDQAGSFRASGVLEFIHLSVNLSICNSTVILTPSPDCVSLNVTCKSNSGPEMSTAIKVAGKVILIIYNLIQLISISIIRGWQYKNVYEQANKDSI